MQYRDWKHQRGLLLGRGPLYLRLHGVPACLETAVWIYILAPRSPTCVPLGIDSLLHRSFVPGISDDYLLLCSRDQIPLPATIDELLLRPGATYSLLPPPCTLYTRRHIYTKSSEGREAFTKREKRTREKGRESRRRDIVETASNPDDLFLARRAMGSGSTALEPYTTEATRHHHHHHDAARR
jgi:hypothetical protein